MVPAAELRRWLLQDGFSLQSISLALLVALLILVFTASCLGGGPETRKKEKPRLPPSPRRLPFVGNLHQLSSLPHRSLHALSQTHGPLMLLHMGQVPTLVVSSTEGAREVMKTRDLAFATRPSSRAADMLSYGSRNVAFAPYGEHWRQAKKAAVVHLLCPNKVQSFQRLREEKVTLMIEKIACAAAASASGTVVDLGDAFHSLSNALVSTAVVGSCSAGEENNRIFREIIDEATAVITGLRLDDVFPSVAWLWTLMGMDSKLWKLFKKYDAFLNQVVDEHEHRAREEDEASDPDFVDVLLSIHGDPNMDFSICRNDIKAILMDMVAAGTDTSYVVLEWAMAELVRNPRVMQRAQREAREIAGVKPMATEDDVAQMSYLQALTKEVLRLHPPAPLLLPRESMEDTQVLGYDVPRKTSVLINVWAIARDPAIWESPEEFRPERFLDSQIDFRGNDFKFTPFGAGRRMCPGINFAVSGIGLALANLLYRFDWAFPGEMGVEDFDMDESPGITIRRKSGLRLVAIPYISTVESTGVGA